jgi:hypothetical protein
MHESDEVQDVGGFYMLTTRERRRNPRVICDYPAIVEWVDKQGNKYKEDAKLANLSGSGLYMLVNRNFELGAKLSVTVNLSSAPTEDETPKLTTKGIVVRVEPKSNGTVGIAIKFYHYRFQ